jgi:hypothetical protein
VVRNNVRSNSRARSGAPASTILFLAANPLLVQMLQLTEEHRAIAEMISKARYREEIGFRACWAARLDDLEQALNDDTPKVLHFSGHGYGIQGICLQGENGDAAIATTDEFVGIMEAAGDGVTAVILNACYTEAQARALVRHVPCVVGMSAAITDSAAIAYSRSLYRALASGRSIENAHRQGVAALRRPRPNEEPRDSDPDAAAAVEVAKLLTRPDVDPSGIYIAGPSARAIRPDAAATRRASRRERQPLEP